MYIISPSGLFGAEVIPAEFPDRDAIVTEVAANKFPVGDGGFVICNPGGKVLAESDPGAEQIINADLQLAATVAPRSGRDQGGHYHRPDVVEINVDRNRRVPATLTDEDDWQSPDHPLRAIGGARYRRLPGAVDGAGWDAEHEGVEFVLVHGPPVGPTTWRWVAEVLTSAGHGVVVPDLRGAALSGDQAAVVADVVAACSPNTDVVVAHSGAGLVLPTVAGLLPKSARPRLVFVDAVIPECDGEAGLDPVVIDLLRTGAVDGVLPPWSDWWGEGAVEQMIPDPERRAEVRAELPRLPMALFEGALPVPAGWCDWSCGFLLLSEDMRDEAERARSLGWSVLEDVGSHLDVVNRAAEVAADLLQMTS